MPEETRISDSAVRIPETPPPVPPLPHPAPARPRLTARYGTALKMAAIAALVLLLLIPLSMVKSVLGERLGRRNQAVAEITATWGNEQVIAGPILIIPYRQTQKVFRNQLVNGRVESVEVSESTVARAYFLPAEIKTEGQLDPSRLHRGIYEAVVYSGKLTLKGIFSRPSFDEWKIDPQSVLWDEAEIAFSITDLRGAKESISIRVGTNTVALKPGARLPGLSSGVHARLPGLSAAEESVPFELSLTLNGSRSIRFAPLGANNDVTLRSSWPDPSFQGAFLPTERTIGPDGFTAHWQVSYYGRDYPQQWTDKTPVAATELTQSLFGVDLVSLLDTYRYVERTIKYGILFIVLLFTAFFLFEVLAAVRIHPFQYTLVGVALCLFYLALIALSEVLSFGAAYWTGATAATAMIAFYSLAVLRGGGRALGVALGLLVVYAFLFVILRLQDYSLLIGTAGLFLVLGIVMFVTRRIDWYARDEKHV